MRGISPVVATILMVVIAIIAAVVAYSWFTSIQGNLQLRAGQHISAISGAVFTLPAARCEGNNLYILIHNLSDEDINAKASIALLDAGGSVIAVVPDVEVNVPAQSATEYNVVFNQSCENAKAVMVTIGSTSAVVEVSKSSNVAQE